jgi:hypothetical protein
MATKREFVENGYKVNSINAAIQRNSPYGVNDSPKVRRAIRGELRRHLTDFVDPFLSRSTNSPVVMPFYRNGGWSNDEAAFLSAVHRLRTVMRRTLHDHGSIGQFRVSHAQKSLAVLLKYYWCAGETAASPPFCPLDRGVLWGADIRENWTQLDEMNKYMRWLQQLAKVANAAGYTSLAEWELATYW